MTFSKILSLSVAFALLIGCRKAEVGSYRVPKEKDANLSVASQADEASPHGGKSPGAATTSSAAPVAPAGGGMADIPVVTASGAGLAWTAPAEWQPKPTGQMRKGSYSVVGEGGATADLSITAFPGAVGGELANVNRWRGQVGLAPIDEAALGGAVMRLNQNGLAITVVDAAGTDPVNSQRILGAMVPYEGAMWFFKLSGPDALVGKTKPAFLEFLKTVKVAAPAAP